MVWLDANPQGSQRFLFGPQTLQCVEIEGILITLQLAAKHSSHTLVICTDSSYAHLSCSCHLASWKLNGFLTANTFEINESCFEAKI